MAKKLQVGIIGASAGGGWAKISHVPALRAVPGLELGAVATNAQESADAAARVFGARAGYGRAIDLIHDPAIDIVTVAVKVIHHRELVLAAIEAGKHVLCEWPLARDVAETRELAAAAAARGVHAVIGLQTRANPMARRARELIGSGAIGRVLSASVLSTAMAFGPDVDPNYAFAERPENGTTLVSIQGGHTLDLATLLLGRFADASALASTQFPATRIGDDPTAHVRVTPDHLLAIARLDDGTPVSIEVAGGRPPDKTPFRFEVVGEAGTVVLDGGAPRGFQSGRLRLTLNGVEQRVDEGDVAALPDAAANVAGLYAALRQDIENGTRLAPGFDQAVRLARSIDDLLDASRMGARRVADNWPGPIS